MRALAGAIHPRFECLVWTAAAAGLRFGELGGLSVDHVNLDRSELREENHRAGIFRSALRGQRCTVGVGLLWATGTSSEGELMGDARVIGAGN